MLNSTNFRASIVSIFPSVVFPKPGTRSTPVVLNTNKVLVLLRENLPKQKQFLEELAAEKGFIPSKSAAHLWRSIKRRDFFSKKVRVIDTGETTHVAFRASKVSNQGWVVSPQTHSKANKVVALIVSQSVHLCESSASVSTTTNNIQLYYPNNKHPHQHYVINNFY